MKNLTQGSLTQDLILTTSYDDPDPEGCDVYGMLPLISEIEEDDEDENENDDDSGAGNKDGDDEQEEEPIVQSSSIEVEVPEGEELPDDDDDAYDALTAPGATDMSPGEAQDLIEYMRPASEEEIAFEEDNPLMKNLRWIDDPAHTADVLKAGKGDKGMTKFLRDASYGETMKNEEEFADRHDTDAAGWSRAPGRYGRNQQESQTRGPSSYRGSQSFANDGQRRRKRHHRHHHHDRQPGTLASQTLASQTLASQTLQPGQPGYVAPYGVQPGQPGYGIQPGQPGYVAPYGIPPYGSVVDPTTAAQIAAFNASHPSGPIPPANPYATAANPYATAANPYATNPYAPYQTPPTVPALTPGYVPGGVTDPNDGYVMGESQTRAAKTAVARGLGRKLVVEHANWLADSDKAAKIAVRPRSYYENVAKLWAADKLKSSTVPTTTSGGATATPGDFVVGANKLLVETVNQRARFSRALGVETDLGGWNPFSAAKNAVKSIAKTTYKYGKKGLVDPLKYGYKYGVKAPLSYTYKGVKYVGKMAEKMALAPLRAIIHRFTGTMTTRRANLLAKQHGLPAPGPTEKAQAASWAKGYVRAKGGKFGGAIASLMGGDEMGLGTGGTAGLIILGPIGLIALLTGLVKTSSPAAPPPAPGSPEAEAEAAAAAQDAGDGSEEQGTADVPPGYGDQDDGSTDASADASADASGSACGHIYTKRRRTISLEQLTRMAPARQAKVKLLISRGLVRVA